MEPRFQHHFPRTEFDHPRCDSIRPVPLVMTQNTAADPGCQWSQQVILTDFTGFPQTLTGLNLGNISIADRMAAIFGTTRSTCRLWFLVQGTLCLAKETAGVTDTVSAVLSPGFTQDLTVAFAGSTGQPGVDIGVARGGEPDERKSASHVQHLGSRWSVLDHRCGSAEYHERVAEPFPGDGYRLRASHRYGIRKRLRSGRLSGESGDPGSESVAGLGDPSRHFCQRRLVGRNHHRVSQRCVRSECCSSRHAGHSPGDGRLSCGIEL